MADTQMMIEKGRGKTKWILLAEDDPTNQFVTKMTLEKNGFTVICANNGIEACRELEIHPFDLVLMDVSMPEMDGFEATRKIRAYLNSTAQVPIIALTAHNLNEVQKKCLGAGMDDYLSKPIKGCDLIAKISTWLKN